jgi:hypothetical protein
MEKILNKSLSLVRVKGYQTIQHILVLGVVLVLYYNQLLSNIWHDCIYHAMSIAGVMFVEKKQKHPVYQLIPNLSHHLKGLKKSNRQN